MAGTICHFEIPADNPKAAGEFYNKLFGWTVAEGAGDYLLVRTSEQADVLGGALFKRGEPGRGVTLYVLVESIEASVEQLEQLGGAVVAPREAVPGMGWTVLATDPQGNPIGLFQQDKDAA